MVQKLLKAGTSVEPDLDNNDDDALGLERYDLARILIDAGANFNPPARWIAGTTPLQMVTERVNMKMKLLLLSLGA